MTSSPLDIAVVAHVRHPIAPPFMGGMEAHCDLLVRALLRRGHRVTLFASGDSAHDLPLHAISATGYESELPWAIWHGRPEHRQWLYAAYKYAWQTIAAGGFDVVHNNSLFPDLHDWAVADGVPMVTSLHVPPFRFLSEAIERACVPWVRQTVTSHSQLPLWSNLDRRRIDVAWNGIDLNRWRFGQQGNGRAVWFGRITPNKGTVEALAAATAAGIGLDVIGPIECGDYFAHVEAAIGGNHRYLGHLSGRALAGRVRAASVMLATPMWDEPFGLNVAEAMASGVPVAALDRGAMREVIGDTGAIAADIRALPAAIANAAGKSRPAARRRAEQLFGSQAMAARYEPAYAAAIAGLGSARASSRRNTAELLA
jgi:glycosyltransferase involved in cell wall biosynthesis